MELISIVAATSVYAPAPIALDPFVEDSHLVGYSYAVELDPGRQTSLAWTVPRTEPPRAAPALKRSGAVAGVALSAGVRAPSRNDAAADPSSSGACWSAGRRKQLRALAESPGASPLQAGHRIPATTAFAQSRASG